MEKGCFINSRRNIPDDFIFTVGDILLSDEDAMELGRRIGFKGRPFRLVHTGISPGGAST